VKSEAEQLLEMLVPSYFNLIDQLRKREEIATMMDSSGESNAFNMALGYTYAALDDLAMRADALLRKGE
jgi:hypothetical protein